MVTRADMKEQLGNDRKQEGRGRLTRRLPPEEREESGDGGKSEPRVREAKSSAEPGSKVKPLSPTTDKPVGAAKKTDEKKIPFMIYLEKQSHGSFAHLHLDVKTEARSSTGKALSQSEMVEVLIEFVVEKTGDNISELVRLAEKLIEKRQK